MPVTADEQQAEHLRELHRSLPQIENVLAGMASNLEMLLVEVRRLREIGNANMRDLADALNDWTAE